MAAMSNVASWVFFGLIVGVITHLIDPIEREHDRGIVGTALLGILGAVLGGLVANLLLGGGVSGFSFSTFIIAALGALVLLFVQRTVRRI